MTVGHGTAGQDELSRLLRAAGVSCVVDVRRFPGSRAHPHVARESMQEWLPAAGVDYRWDERLGGRRPLPPDAPDVWWQVAAFRAYAAHMRTPDFVAAVDELVGAPATATTAVMCSESLWWRCHRRLVADFLVLARSVPVSHLGHDGRLHAHVPSPGARLTDEGLLRYDEPAG